MPIARIAQKSALHVWEEEQTAAIDVQVPHHVIIRPGDVIIALHSVRRLGPFQIAGIPVSYSSRKGPA
jgi:hypothetical protein